MYFSVDRIVSGVAVLFGEDVKPLEVSLKQLPEGVKEGDIIYYNESEGQFLPSPEKTDEARRRVANMLGTLLHSNENEK